MAVGSVLMFVIIGLRTIVGLLTMTKMMMVPMMMAILAVKKKKLMMMVS